MIQDLQDTIQKSSILETLCLNTKDIKSQVEREVLSQIKEAYTLIFEPFTNRSTIKYL